MASFRKRAGGWYAEVARRGVRDSKTFPTKAEAQAWAKLREEEILTGVPTITRGTVGAAFDRYAREVSPTKRGKVFEEFRLAAFRKTTLASIPLIDLRPSHIAAWRDERLRQVKPGSVAREFNLIRSVLEIARREWGWIPTNPARDVKSPAEPPPRQRRVNDDEIHSICMALGYTHGSVPMNVSQRIAVAFLLAIETGMRTGELCGLLWANTREKAVTLPRTKNGDQRDVPLSTEARRLIGLLPRDTPYVLNLKPKQVDALFRKARKIAKIEDLHFHDTRAEFCTRAARKVDVMDLARIIGHRDLKSLRVYYRATADEIADRLG